MTLLIRFEETDEWIRLEFSSEPFHLIVQRIRSVALRKAAETLATQGYHIGHQTD